MFKIRFRCIIYQSILIRCIIYQSLLIRCIIYQSLLVRCIIYKSLLVRCIIFLHNTSKFLSEPPRFPDGVRTVEVGVGGTASLTCTGRGDAPLAMLWLRSNRTLLQLPRLALAHE